MEDHKQYLSPEKFAALKQELQELKEQKIPGLAKRIDDARQMGDLSENAEYHTAREEMAWAQSRAKEIEFILGNAEVISGTKTTGRVTLGSNVTVATKGRHREFKIVGAQEADPVNGSISNESPLGQAFLGRQEGDVVEVDVPAGTLQYKIIRIV